MVLVPHFAQGQIKGSKAQWGDAIIEGAVVDGRPVELLVKECVQASIIVAAQLVER